MHHKISIMPKNRAFLGARRSLREVAACSFLNFFMVISFANGAWCAQDLTKRVDLDGVSFDVSLMTRDPQCQKPVPLAAGQTLCMLVSIKWVGKAPEAAWLRDFALKRWDATMPDHHHGMVTRPKIKAASATESMVAGVKFHMAGEWLVRLDFVHGKSSTQVAIPVKL
jgi:hypothetical protein